MTTHSKAPGGEGLPVVAWQDGDWTQAERPQDACSDASNWVPLVRLSDAITHAATLRAEVERLTCELAALKREAVLQALSDSGQEIEAMERVERIMRLAEAMSRADVCCVLTAETKAYHESYRIRDAARTALRAALEAKP